MTEHDMEFALGIDFLENAESEEDETEEDDLITLCGHNELSFWQFPRQKYCPVESCSVLFGVRSDAIRHYKKKHANHSVFCPICDTPFSVEYPFQFREHYNRKHPDVALDDEENEEVQPKDAKLNQAMLRRSMRRSVYAEASEVPDGDDDDLITLFGGVQWRFPKDMEDCPHCGPKEDEFDRSDLINHFKLQHASFSHLCNICDLPISIRNDPEAFIKHFKKSHPGDEPMLDEATPHEATPDESMGECSYSKTPNRAAKRQSMRRNVNMDASGGADDEPTPDESTGECSYSKLSNRAAKQKFMRRRVYVEASEVPDGDDDLITLFGDVQWRFPKDMKDCPDCGPNGAELDRPDLINHFKSQHASFYHLCNVCDLPISIQKDPKAFTKHFKKYHPNEEPMPEDPLNESSYSKPTRSSLIKKESINDLIELRGLGQTTYWRFPEDLRHCQRCDRTFNNRSDAISHYKEQHAEHSILCEICDKPIAGLKNSFVDHYHKKHPNEVIPYNLEAQIKRRSNVTENNCDEVDVIPLKGADQITYWRFPANERRCPSVICDGVFLNRIEAIEHYKKKHAANATLCAICRKPVHGERAADFLRHLKKKHPKHAIPQNIAEKLTTEQKEKYYLEMNIPHVNTVEVKNVEQKVLAVKRTTINEQKNEEEDDYITLTSYGQITYYKFPQNKTDCSVLNCKSVFDTRSDAIQHYKQQHAQRSIFCRICDRPIVAWHKNAYLDHFKKLHPNHEPFETTSENTSRKKATATIKTTKGKFDSATSVCDVGTKNAEQIMVTAKRGTINENEDKNEDDYITLSGGGQKTYYKFPQNKTNCPVQTCRKNFESRFEAIQHYKQQHAHRSIFCRICERPLISDGKKDYLVHFKKLHPRHKPFEMTIEIMSPKKAAATTNMKMEIVSVEETQDDGDEDSSDIIELSGWPQQLTYWKVPPDIMDCPSKFCRKPFNSRADFVQHYRSKHAKEHASCTICGKVICTSNLANFETHYKRMHPSQGIPATHKPTHNIANVTIDHVPSTSKNIVTKTNTSEGNSTMNLEKSSTEKKKIDCPMLNCKYKSEHINKIHRHWDCEHPNFKFPIYRDGYSLSYVERSNNTNESDDPKPSTSTASVPTPSTSKAHHSTPKTKTPSDSESEFQPDTSEVEKIDAQQEDLLIPTNESSSMSSSDESSSDKYSCGECGALLNTEIGFRRHLAMKHNIHSVKRRRKRKETASKPSKKRKLMLDTSGGSESDNIPLAETQRQLSKPNERIPEQVKVQLNRIPLLEEIAKKEIIIESEPEDEEEEETECAEVSPDDPFVYEDEDEESECAEVSPDDPSEDDMDVPADNPVISDNLEDITEVNEENSAAIHHNSVLEQQFELPPASKGSINIIDQIMISSSTQNQNTSALSHAYSRQSTLNEPKLLKQTTMDYFLAAKEEIQRDKDSYEEKMCTSPNDENYDDDVIFIPDSTDKDEIISIKGSSSETDTDSTISINNEYIAFQPDQSTIRDVQASRPSVLIMKKST